MHKRIVSLLTLLLMAGMVLPLSTRAQQPQSLAPTSREPSPAAQRSKLSPAPTQKSAEDQKTAHEQALAKLHPDLRKVVTTAGSPRVAGQPQPQASDSSAPIFVELLADADVADAVAQYFVDSNLLARPALRHGASSLHIYFGQIEPANLIKVAGVAQVQALLPLVFERNAEPEDMPIDEQRELPEKTMDDWKQLRAQADKRRDGARPWPEARAFGDGRAEPQPMDWYEVKREGPHKAEAAWARGYTGEGVSVAVLDDGIDAAHPDLMGTQKIYQSEAAPQYNGWPVVFSPFSQLLYALDETYGSSYVAGGYASIHYVDTSATPELSPCGVGISCLNYTPLLGYDWPNPFAPEGGYTYVISNTMSQSGRVHIGTHPDNDLRDYIWGEKPAVLVADPNQTGVYDTVYVDLDDDYDFRDEKPLTRADVSSPAALDASRNNPIAYRDMDGDGLADISGGMLYFIGDGKTPIPGSDYMWGASCSYGFMCPGNGDLVAFSGGTFDRSYSHGTACASNIVGQGRSNGLLPEFSDLASGSAAGRPEAAVYGMAPDAKVVNISDIYYNFESSTLDAYFFSAFGYDGIDQTGYRARDKSPGHSDTDAIQITTNSYGSSSDDNDGWELHGQFASQIQRWYAPNLQFLFSTGNGASAYGTVAPPSGATTIGVGASTQYGSTGWDSITSTNQIMHNDVTPFSNRGPGARGTNGVGVVAGGAFAAGAQELNYYSTSQWGAPNGNRSWSSWGGTSRSAPVAGGVLALLYQAYYDANGEWPSYDVAKQLLMSSATDINYDTFTQGAGSVNADRGTAVAGGHYGLYADTATWEPGDYRGEDYPGFAHLSYPGDTDSKTITLNNTGSQPVNAEITDAELQLVKSETFDFTVTPEMVQAESAYGAENRDNFYKAFNYFIPITGDAAADPAWSNLDVPADTELMVVRQVLPFEQFDVDGDYKWNQRYYLTVYNWKDVDGDGHVWDDKDGNGVVNFINSDTASQIDGAKELVWDDPRTELDRWEFGRFSYHRPIGNRAEMLVHDPLERMHDGLFIGLRHLSNLDEPITTTLSYRVDFYQKTDVPWLDTSASNLAVPGGGSASFDATVQVPDTMPAGVYQAAVQVRDPGFTDPQTDKAYAPDTIVIPVTLNVAAPFSPGMQLGGEASYAYDAARPYNNGAVRGLFDWGWRAESGDWRFFFTDVPDATYPDGTKLLAKNEWADRSPPTDIDSIVLGPALSPLGAFGGGFAEPGYYGPYTLETVGKSPNTNAGGGTWRFNTSSGGAEDWVSAPLKDGLHGLLSHNVLFAGDAVDVVFTQTLGTLNSTPDRLHTITNKNSGVAGTISMESSLKLNGVVAEAFGLGAPQETLDIPLDHINSDVIEWTKRITVEHGAKIELSTSSSNISDIDLFLFYCGPTGESECQSLASSTTGSSNEKVSVLMPADGVYSIGINNWSGPAGTFNLVENVVQGYDLTVSNLPEGELAAGTPVSFTVEYSRELELGAQYEGLVLFGIPESPALIQVPVTIERSSETARIEKSADAELAFRGSDLNYTIDLYNLSDAEAEFEMADVVPQGLEVLAVDGAAHDAASNTVSFSGQLPLSDGEVPSHSIVVSARVLEAATPRSTITNTAMLTATHAGDGGASQETYSSSAATYIGAPDFSSSYVEADKMAHSGAEIQYDFHVINSGEELANVSFAAPIPAGTEFSAVDNAPPTQGLSYNPADRQLEWSGNIGPGEERVFTFWIVVDDDPALEGTTITTTGTVSWDSETLQLTAETLVGRRVLLPAVSRQ